MKRARGVQGTLIEKCTEYLAFSTDVGRKLLNFLRIIYQLAAAVAVEMLKKIAKSIQNSNSKANKAGVLKTSDEFITLLPSIHPRARIAMYSFLMLCFFRCMILSMRYTIVRRCQ